MGRFAQHLKIGVKGEVQIRLAKRVNYAGEQLSGVVTLRIQEPLDAKDFVLRIKGKEKVMWTTESNNTRTVHKFSNVFLDAQVVLLEGSASSGGTVALAPGEQACPFSLQLAPNLPGSCIIAPASFASLCATIKYTISAEMRVKGSFVSDLSTKIYPIVLPSRAPLPRFVQAMEAATAVSVVTFCCFNRGQYELSGVLERDVYAVGDLVRVRCAIRNTSSVEIYSVRLQLVRVVTITGTETRLDDSELSDIIQETLTQGVAPGENLDMLLSFTLEDTPARVENDELIHTTTAAHFFSASFEVRVQCKVFGSASGALEFPVTIVPQGTPSFQHPGAGAMALPPVSGEGFVALVTPVASSNSYV